MPASERAGAGRIDGADERLAGRDVVRRRVEGRRVDLAAVDFGRAVVDLGLVAVLGFAALADTVLARVVLDLPRTVEVFGLAEDAFGLLEEVRGLAAAGFLAVVRDLLAEVLDFDAVRVVLRAGFAGAFTITVAGLAVDMVLAAMVSALAAEVIALVAVFMAVMAEDIVLADEVALVAAAFILLAADVTLVAADETVLAAVAAVIADFAVDRRGLLDEMLRDELVRGFAVVLRLAVLRLAVLRLAVLLDFIVLRDLGAVLRLAAVRGLAVVLRLTAVRGLAAVLRLAVVLRVAVLLRLAAVLRLAVVLREDLAADLRAVDAAVRALTPVARVLDLVFGRLAVPPDALRLTDLLRAAVAVLRRAAARFVV